MTKRTKSFLKEACLASTILAASACLTGNAVAQESRESDTAADEEATSRMDRIVVTATKREQTLQDTPIAITVASSETIERAKIINLEDLQTVVPSLRISSGSRVNQSTFAIRGFGNGGSSTGGEPAVGVFIDGVFRSRSSSAVLDLPRVERVEVLSGPQSTLFGKNASAGVVSVVTKAPSFEPSGSIEATVGNYNQYILKGHYTGPISENVAFTLSGMYNRRDGYTESIVGLGDLNDKNRWNVRGDLLIEPSEQTSVRIIADYTKLDEICCTVGNIVNGPTEAVINALGGQIASDVDQFSYTSILDVNPENKNEDYGASIHVEHDFGDVILSSITAYRDNTIGPVTSEIDYTSLDLAQSVGTVREFDTYTQELRLTSDTDSPFSWMIGGYLFYEEIDELGSTVYGDDLRPYVDALTGNALTLTETFAGAPTGSYFAGGTTISTRFTQENTSYSLFGTADFDVTDRLTLTGGLNYTEDEKTITIDQFRNEDAFSQLDLTTFLGGALAGLRGVQFRAPTLNCPNAVEDCKSNDDELTYLARANYAVSDNVNVYVSTATGFKGTSWSSGQPPRSLQAQIEAAGIGFPDQRYGSRNAGPESSTVYELGLKANFEQGYFNLEIFDQSIDNFQTRGFDGVNFILTNAGEYAAQGIEFDLLFSPNENWTFQFAGTYLDPIYEDYQNAPAPVGSSERVIDRSGTEPGGIHPFSGVAIVTYDHEFSNGMNGYIRGEYLYESEAGLTDAFPNIDREVGTLNASAGLTVTENLSAQLWVRNLNEDNYFIGAFNGVAQSGTINSFYNAPRLWGGSIIYTF